MVKMMNLSLRSIFIHTLKGCLKCRKILRHGADGYTSPPKEGVLRILLPLKIHRPWPGLNPRTFGPVAITLRRTRDLQS
jgi:hypothetical protein